MGKAGITLAEECHIVNAVPPRDMVTSAITTDWIKMDNAGHITFIVFQGVCDQGVTITCEHANDAAGASNETMVFDYYLEPTANGDTLGARTSATTAGISINVNDNTMIVVEIDADEIPDEHNWIALQLDAATAAAIYCVGAILSGYRYQRESNVSAIV